jgi:hypothetical protein
MPPHEDPRANSQADPERLLEALRLRHGAARHAARRRLPLVRRALKAPPELRARLLAVVEAALAHDAAGARRRDAEGDQRWLCALAPLLERW